MTVCFWQEVSDQKELKNTLEEAAKAYETVALSLNQPHTPVPPCDFNEDTNSIATLAYQMVSRYKSAVEYRCKQKEGIIKLILLRSSMQAQKETTVHGRLFYQLWQILLRDVSLESVRHQTSHRSKKS